MYPYPKFLKVRSRTPDPFFSVRIQIPILTLEIAINDVNVANCLNLYMSKCFTTKDLGPVKKILGMDIERTTKHHKLYISQSQYTSKVLEHFNMNNCKPISTPLANHFKLSKRNSPTNKTDEKKMHNVLYTTALGSLKNVMVYIRPNIVHAVVVVLQYMSNLRQELWYAVKQIFQYLNERQDACLCFRGLPLEVLGFIEKHKSTYGYIFKVGGGAVSWMSRLQNIITLLTTEAEYVALEKPAKEMVQLRRLLDEFGVRQENYVMHCDSQRATDLSKNAVYHFKMKYIEVLYHFIQLALEHDDFQLNKTHIDKNLTKKLTKFVSIDINQMYQNHKNLENTQPWSWRKMHAW